MLPPNVKSLGKRKDVNLVVADKPGSVLMFCIGTGKDVPGSTFILIFDGSELLALSDLSEDIFNYYKSINS